MNQTIATATVKPDPRKKSIYLQTGACDKKKDPRFNNQIDFIPFAFHLVPRSGLAKVAAVMRQGELTGRRDEGWREVPLIEQVNHAISHLLAYLDDPTAEQHLANAGCRVLMALDLDPSAKPVVNVPRTKVDEIVDVMAPPFPRFLHGPRGEFYAYSGHPREEPASVPEPGIAYRPR